MHVSNHRWHIKNDKKHKAKLFAFVNKCIDASTLQTSFICSCVSRYRPRTYCLADSDEESSSAGSSDEEDSSDVSNDLTGAEG